jgi:hypothetical protein
MTIISTDLPDHVRSLLSEEFELLILFSPHLFQAPNDEFVRHACEGTIIRGDDPSIRSALEWLNERGWLRLLAEERNGLAFGFSPQGALAMAGLRP